ncbi:lysine--tRNA ligase [Candidatus Gracilibacteria bacterium]|nr:lysine--tRNA ligase [Candidatus Gracilibacteria bacterium]MCF7819406.1 lysine--tRNA ligase [Candidatus Gracilibacteria bacterium]
MSEENSLRAERREKLEQWRKLGFDYAAKFDRTHTSAEAKKAIKKKAPRDTEKVMQKPSSSIRLCGRIVNIREMGKLAFLRLRDQDGDFQICFAQKTLEDEYKTFLKILDLGDFCGFEGEFFITRHGEPTLLAVKVVPLSKAIRPLPEKWHGLSDREARYRQRYLDLLSNPETFARFQIRSQIIQKIRDFLLQKNFQEVETRVLQPQAGGAMARVFKTHHEALDHEFVLRIALELDLKMLLVGGMERVFEIGKCFRNEGMDPSHLQEFTLLEWYAAYADLNQNMDWTEEMIRWVLQEVLGKTTLTISGKEGKPHTVDFGKKWKKVRFPDVLKEYADLNMQTASREEIENAAKKWKVDTKEIKKASTGNLLDDIYKKSSRPYLIEPTFVLDYPSELKPLARPKEDGTAECYQLLVGGWEIVNSYGELIDSAVQRKLLEAQAQAKAAGDEEAMNIDEEFLTAMEHGMPPMTGFGMGIDRFVSLITEQINLKDVILFPLMKPE